MFTIFYCRTFCNVPYPVQSRNQSSSFPQQPNSGHGVYSGSPSTSSSLNSKIIVPHSVVASTNESQSNISTASSSSRASTSSHVSTLSSDSEISTDIDPIESCFFNLSSIIEERFSNNSQNYLKHGDDNSFLADEAFANFIALELSNLDKQTQVLKKQRLLQVLFE